MCLAESSSIVVAASMQKKYSAYSGLLGVLECDPALVAQDKQQRGKNQIHMTVRILKVKVVLSRLSKELNSLGQHQNA